MAGRGTDIKLGPGVKEVGGLAVIGTERHESRRIDNQLRGRSGRQGDPGVTQFYLSLEDTLMKRFGSERIQNLLSQLKINGEDAVIQSRMITRQVESAQERVEGNNYDTRRNVLKYDDVMREQREVIYTQRYEVIMEDDSLSYVTVPMIKRTIDRYVDNNTQGDDKAKWYLETIVEFAQNVLMNPEAISLEDLEGKSRTEIKDLLSEKSKELYNDKMEQLNGKEQALEFEKVVVLRVVDRMWTNHIDQMDQLRQGIGLRSYGQLNPLTEYQQEGYRLFGEMIGEIEYEVTRLLMKSQIRQNLQREQATADGKGKKANKPASKKSKKSKNTPQYSHDEETNTTMG